MLVDGFDLDAPSIEMARANAVEAGLADRVRFHVRDAADPELAGRYDFVMAMECIHDMSNPVGALRTIRRLLAPGGADVAELRPPAGFRDVEILPVENFLFRLYRLWP